MNLQFGRRSANTAARPRRRDCTRTGYVCCRRRGMDPHHVAYCPPADPTRSGRLVGRAGALASNGHLSSSSGSRSGRLASGDPVSIPHLPEACAGCPRRRRSIEERHSPVSDKRRAGDPAPTAYHGGLVNRSQPGASDSESTHLTRSGGASSGFIDRCALGGSVLCVWLGSINLPRRTLALPRLDARESTAIEIAN